MKEIKETKDAPRDSWGRRYCFVPRRIGGSDQRCKAFRMVEGLGFINDARGAIAKSYEEARIDASMMNEKFGITQQTVDDIFKSMEATAEPGYEEPAAKHGKGKYCYVTDCRLGSDGFTVMWKVYRAVSDQGIKDDVSGAYFTTEEDASKHCDALNAPLGLTLEERRDIQWDAEAYEETKGI
jgi:hypothetical protein